LRIVFRSPVNEILPVMAKLNYQLPAPNDQGEKTSPFTRKAPYHYGWDWGPRFVTSGIWRPVSLEAWDQARVSNLQLVVKKISADAAELTANVEVEANDAGTATILLDNLTDKTVAGKQQVALNKGTIESRSTSLFLDRGCGGPTGLAPNRSIIFALAACKRSRSPTKTHAHGYCELSSSDSSATKQARVSCS
jgi:hypothetical protein